jgi:hypothetical protein
VREKQLQSGRNLSEIGMDLQAHAQRIVKSTINLESNVFINEHVVLSGI